MSSTGFLLFCLVLVLAERFGACNVLRETVSDEREKRAVDYPSGGITLNFGHGMRDFIVNGKGVAVHGQTVSVIAFQATLTSGNIGPNYADGVIKFNDVALNIGNGYNSNTGMFTAPIGGLYQFSVTYLQVNGYSSHVKLIKGNKDISEMHADHKNYDQLTKTILVAMNKGETFWVKLEKNGAYAVYGLGRYTQIGGFLLSIINKA